MHSPVLFHLNVRLTFNIGLSHCHRSRAIPSVGFTTSFITDWITLHEKVINKLIRVLRILFFDTYESTKKARRSLLISISSPYECHTIRSIKSLSTLILFCSFGASPTVEDASLIQHIPDFNSAFEVAQFSQGIHLRRIKHRHLQPRAALDELFEPSREILLGYSHSMPPQLLGNRTLVLPRKR